MASLLTLDRKSSLLFLVLGGIFITNALIAELIGVKIFSLEGSLGIDAFELNPFGGENTYGFNLTVGVVLWPVVFVLTDIVNEYFGQSGVRFLSYLTVILIVYAFFAFYVGIHLVPADFWPSSQAANGVEDMNLAFRAIFGQGLWIIIGSLVAFLIGQLVDVFVFQKIKRLTGEGNLWLRATGSTLVSQFIDSYVVLIIAFYVGAGWSLELVLAIGTVNYFFKFVVAVGLTPVIYLMHEVIDRFLGAELAERLKNDALSGSRL